MTEAVFMICFIIVHLMNFRFIFPAVPYTGSLPDPHTRILQLLSASGVLFSSAFLHDFRNGVWIGPPL